MRVDPASVRSPVGDHQPGRDAGRLPATLLGDLEPRVAASDAASRPSPGRRRAPSSARSRAGCATRRARRGCRSIPRSPAIENVTSGAGRPNPAAPRTGEPPLVHRRVAAAEQAVELRALPPLSIASRIPSSASTRSSEPSVIRDQATALDPRDRRLRQVDQGGEVRLADAPRTVRPGSTARASRHPCAECGDGGFATTYLPDASIASRRCST